MSTSKILHDAELFRNQISKLKEIAPPFPVIYTTETHDKTIWATTIVEFAYEGKLYKRHHVESIVPTNQVTTKDLINKIKQQCELTIKHAVPCSLDEAISKSDQ